MNIIDYTNYLIYLVSCAVNSKKADRLDENINLDILLKFAVFHKVENMLFDVLSDVLKGRKDDAVLQIYKYFVNAVYVDTHRTKALNKIYKAFEENEIAYMPLKGSIIKDYYPESYLRTSSDIDILINEEDAKKARDVLEKIGFKNTIFEKMHHDNYEQGVILLEIHRTLVPEKYSYKDVCDSIEKSKVKEEGSNFRYKMSDEDFYAFMIIHIAKHIKNSGIGIKFILDVWVYLKNKGDSLDWDKIQKRMKEANLVKFEGLIKELCYVWFDNKESSQEIIKKLGEFIAISGWVGTKNMRLSCESAEMSEKELSKNKFKYYFNAVFLPFKSMKEKYPILETYPALLPFMHIRRVFDVLINRRQMFSAVKKHYDNVSIEYGQSLGKFKEEIGIY